MGKNLYVGVGGKARKRKAAYIGISGKARKIKKIYVGVGGKARLVYQSYVAGKTSQLMFQCLHPMPPIMEFRFHSLQALRPRCIFQVQLHRAV